uniref:Uncharacterized protein n=1 Tax=Siphoviridae sp. ct3z32 TaxID=2825327 RepID=A0A8S5VHI6_9CAUD|nr:MAG TPA: hypothetical protein [Siphoviridae sp. ct3z32]
MLCRDSIIYVCVGFPFKDKEEWRLTGAIALRENRNITV